MLLNACVTDCVNFFEGNNPCDIAKEFGTPLYVYNERILRDRIREMKSLMKYPNFQVNFSVKANSNLAILQIAKSEDINVDAMSPGEILVELAAGFSPSQILFICNNVSADEMKFAIEHDILVSVDSISQLDLFGRINPGGRVVIRFNPGVGAGHHEKVITAGSKTKFAVNPEYIPEVKNILKKYDLKLVGINQHIGSLFMSGDSFIKSAQSILNIAENFPEIKFVDLGGGFGIPYQKQQNQSSLDLKLLGAGLDELLSAWVAKTGNNITIKIEPGRYIAAECGILLGTVHAVKYNLARKYIGTDLGFNVLARPVLYNSHHDIEVYRNESNISNVDQNKEETVTVVGNICETGDIIASDRLLPEIFEGDILGVLDAGAYGHVMSSNYNNRLRPAEVLIRTNGEIILIRKRDSYEDILRNYISL